MPSFRNLLPGYFAVKTPIDKTPADLFDLLVRLYAEEKLVNPNDDYLADHGNPFNINNHVQTFCWYLPFLPASGKVLDLGCNHAPDSCMIRAAFGDTLELYGCDVGETGGYPVFHAAAKLNYTKLPDHNKLPFESGTFDAIVASGSLEHAAFDYKILEEAYRILKPNGTLIVSYLPNRFSYHEWIMEHIKRREFHLRLYGLGEAKRLMKHNGFFPIQAGAHTFFWERKLISLGISPYKRGLIRFLSCVIPLHLVSGCLKLIAVKKNSM